MHEAGDGHKDINNKQMIYNSKTNHGEYMHMRRACENPNMRVTPEMLSAYSAGGNARAKLFQKWVIHDKDCEKISIDVMKDNHVQIVIEFLFCAALSNLDACVCSLPCRGWL